MLYQTQLQSPLLALPRELRDLIYKFTLIDTTIRVGPYYQRKARGVGLRLRAKNPKDLAKRNAGLILACKQLLDETLLLYYRYTSFTVSNFGCMSCWIKVLRSEAIGAITEIIEDEFGVWRSEKHARKELAKHLGRSAEWMREGVVRVQIAGHIEKDDWWVGI